jgi:hypothetical protein
MAAALAVSGVVAAAWAVHRVLGRSDAGAASQDRVFICAETGRVFRHRLVMADTIPVRSPYTGKATGYPAELCYWTSDGRAGREPIAVLLNTYRGGGEPTFCPECGRLVVKHNPCAGANTAPPPTMAEYKAIARSRQGGEVH